MDRIPALTLKLDALRDEEEDPAPASPASADLARRTGCLA